MQARNPKFRERISAMLARPITRDFYQMRAERIEPGEVVLVIDSRPELGHQPGWFQGTITTAIAELAGAFATLSMVPEDWETMTINQTIHFTGPARGEQLLAVGTVDKAGKTISAVRVQVFVVREGERFACASMLQTNCNLQRGS